MDFNLFEKLSDLETKVYVLEKELEDKDIEIQTLVLRNKQLEQELEAAKLQCANTAVNLEEECDLITIESGKSIAEALRETSESVIQHTGYAFDERTGLYFDRISGYYYDPDHQLFFEPRTGTYYSYNAETGEYTYRSSVDSSRLAKLQDLFTRNSEKSNAKTRPNHEDSAKSRRNRSRSRSRSSSESSSRRSRNRRRRNKLSSRYRRHHRSPHGRSICSYASAESSSTTDSEERQSYAHHPNTTTSENETSIRNAPSSPAEELPTSFTAKPTVYPPGMRLVVLSSEHVSIGTVFILTSEETSRGWGCIGRNPTFCPSVNFPDDPEVGTIHCEVIYNEVDNCYSLLDRESSSGTLLNGRAVPKGTPVRMNHGDILRVGATRLLVHIHRGLEVCDQCDPEVLLSFLKGPEEEAASLSTEAGDPGNINVLSGAERRDVHRRIHLDLLKEKYGIRYLGLAKSAEKTTGYNDRAAQRRAIQANLKAAGLDETSNPPEDMTPKPVKVVVETQTAASLDVPIGTENRGAQLLAKMGWKLGEGLGKNRSGIVEPVPLAIRPNAQAGLGSEQQHSKRPDPIPPGTSFKELQKTRIRVLTRERYDKAQ